MEKICLNTLARERYGVPIGDCSDAQIYALLFDLVQRARHGESVASEPACGGRRLYYLCAEFMVGKLLWDHLMALGIGEQVREQLLAAGKSPELIAAMEREPALGNGGLGRLAACILDSIAALGLPGEGVGLLWRCGLFCQRFEQRQQIELPDRWIEQRAWLQPTDVSLTVECMGKSLRARMYDMQLPTQGGTGAALHLFEVATADENAAGIQSISFDRNDLARCLTLFLYPDDSTQQGKRFRLAQQYFLAVCAAERILSDCRTRGWQCGCAPLENYAVIQINDTHPALVIPVLIQRLTQQGLEEREAMMQVRRACAYTNHTVMSEALERWHMADIEAVCPALVPLLWRMDDEARRMARQRGGNEQLCALIANDQHLAMAHLAVHFSDAVNGVAPLHSTLLKTSVLPALYAVYPERFGNKTNGVSHRRWLLGCNRPLTRWIAGRIGREFVTDPTRLAALEAYENDQAALSELWEIKQRNKQRLARYLAAQQGLQLMCHGVFDLQIKRLHEYKRQQLSALYLIDKLLSARQGESLPVALVALFAAKAAPSYTAAKDILHLLLCLQELCAHELACAGRLQIAVVENYNVTAAEYLIPAAELSEQISLASKEASGTGNMKMMMNGALTLGTEDGANIEILQAVGRERMYLFGLTGEQVTALEQKGGYHPREYYESNARLRRAVDFIAGDELCAIGNRERLLRLRDALIGCDRFMTLADFDAYRICRDRALSDYTDQQTWAKKMLINIARSGYFSSDRTVMEYNRDVWHLRRVGEGE